MKPADHIPPPMPVSTDLYRERLWLIAIFAILLAGCASLWFVNPSTAQFSPQCPSRVLLHLNCPGCGGLRATHAMLHLDIAKAFQLNPMLFLIAPALLYGLARRTLRAARAQPPDPLASRVPTPVIWGIFAILTLYMVARNLPFWPFFLLAPP